MDKYERAERERREDARRLILLIEADIDSALVALAGLSLADSESLVYVRDRARSAYEHVTQFLPRVNDSVEQQRLREKHRALADAIEDADRGTKRDYEGGSHLSRES